jgi:hypothetical protein
VIIESGNFSGSDGGKWYFVLGNCGRELKIGVHASGEVKESSSGAMRIVAPYFSWKDAMHLYRSPEAWWYEAKRREARQWMGPGYLERGWK